MFFVLAIFATSADKNVCYGGNLQSVPCTVVSDVAALKNIFNEQTDPKITVFVYLFLDIVIPDAITCKSQINFMEGNPTSPRAHTVTWNFAKGQKGVVSFGNIKYVTPYIIKGTTDLELYGDSISLTLTPFQLPEGITHTICRINDIAASQDFFQYIDEVDVKTIDFTLSIWPTNPDITTTFKMDANTKSFKITATGDESDFHYFNFAMGESSVVMSIDKENSSKIIINQTVTTKPLSLDLSSINIRISQTSPKTSFNYQAKVKNTKYSFVGNTPVTSVGEQLPNWDVNSVTYDIQVSLPNYKFVIKPDTVERITMGYGKSVNFAEIMVDVNTKLPYSTVTITSTNLYLNAPVSVQDLNVQFHIDNLYMNLGSGGDIMTIEINIICDKNLYINSYPMGLTMKGFIFSESSAIVMKYFPGSLSDNNYITVKQITLGDGDKIKIYYYADKDDFDSFASELSQTDIKNIHGILKSDNFPDDTTPILDYSIYSTLKNVPEQFSSEKSIIDAKYNSTEKSIGIKFTKSFIPLVTVNVGETGTPENEYTYNVGDILDSSKWNVKNASDILKMQINIKKNLAGSLNLDSLALNKVELDIIGVGTGIKLNLGISQKASDHISKIIIYNLEITSSIAFSWKCKSIDVSAWAFSGNTLQNMKFDNVEELTITEAQIKALDSILNQPKLVNIPVSGTYSAIKYKASSILLNEKETTINAKKAIITFQKNVDLTHDVTTINNILIQAPEREIIIKDDWSNSPNSFPIAIGLDKVNVDASATNILPVHIIARSKNDLYIKSTKKSLKINYKVDYLDLENPDQIGFKLNIHKPSQGASSLEAITFDDFDYSTGIILTSEYQASIGSINTHPKTFSEVSSRYNELKKDPSFPSYSNFDIARLLLPNSQISVNSLATDKLVVGGYMTVQSDRKEKIKNIDITFAGDTIPPYLVLDSVYANESVFSIKQHDVSSNIDDLFGLFINYDQLIANVKNINCNDIKGLSGPDTKNANDGTIQLDVRCSNEVSGSLIYAKLTTSKSAPDESKGNKLQPGAIAGISVGVVVAVIGIIIAVLIGIGIIECQPKDGSSGMEKRDLAGNI